MEDTRRCFGISLRTSDQVGVRLSGLEIAQGWREGGFIKHGAKQTDLFPMHLLSMWIAREMKRIRCLNRKMEIDRAF
jgi:hypothetical protein